MGESRRNGEWAYVTVSWTCMWRVLVVVRWQSRENRWFAWFNNQSMGRFSIMNKRGDPWTDLNWVSRFAFCFHRNNRLQTQHHLVRVPQAYGLFVIPLKSHEPILGAVYICIHDSGLAIRAPGSGRCVGLFCPSHHDERCLCRLKKFPVECRVKKNTSQNRDSTQKRTGDGYTGTA